MQVNASIDESDIGRIKPGQTVTFQRRRVSAARPFTGTVSQVRLEPVVAQNVVSYVTMIDVPNPELKLKPGMTANVTVEIARADDVLRVPNAALRFRPEARDDAASRGRQIRRATVPQSRGDARSRMGFSDGQLQPVRVRDGHQRRHDDGDCRVASSPRTRRS